MFQKPSSPIWCSKRMIRLASVRGQLISFKKVTKKLIFSNKTTLFLCKRRVAVASSMLSKINWKNFFCICYRIQTDFLHQAAFLTVTMYSHQSCCDKIAATIAMYPQTERLHPCPTALKVLHGEKRQQISRKFDVFKMPQFIIRTFISFQSV